MTTKRTPKSESVKTPASSGSKAAGKAAAAVASPPAGKPAAEPARVIGAIDKQTRMGTVFEFEIAAGDVDPRDRKKCKAGDNFTLSLTKMGPGSYGFKHVASDGDSTLNVEITKASWAERYAPAATGAIWLPGKAASGSQAAGKPAAAELPEIECKSCGVNIIEAETAAAAAPPAGKPKGGGEISGTISRQTPVGTVFEFDLKAGDVDPRSGKPAKKAERFRLVITEHRPGGLWAVPPESEGGKPGFSVDYHVWNQKMAAAVTGVDMPGMEPPPKAKAGKPAGLREIPTSPFAKRPENRPPRAGHIVDVGGPVYAHVDVALPAGGKLAAKPPGKKPAAKSAARPAAKPAATPPPAAGPPPDDPAAANYPRLVLIPVVKIKREVDNCRGAIDEAKLAQLAASIERVGLMHAIAVCERGNKFVLIAGHRRLAAIHVLKRTMIGARVYHNLTNEQIAEMQFLENLQREDLTAIEEARGIAALIKAGQSIDTVASRIDRSTDFVRGRLDLLRLAEPIQQLVSNGRIPIKHARLIARVGDARGQLIVAATAMGGRYYGGGSPSKKLMAELAKSDHIAPLQDVRNCVTIELQAMGSARWPMDKKYAGRRACRGCPDNSATEPALFDRIKLPGQSPKGNCSNQPCFAAKVKVWARDPEKKKQDKERSAKADAKTKTAGGKAAGKGADAVDAKRKAFPSTGPQRFAMAMWKYGKKLADQIVAFLKDPKKLPPDALQIAVRIGLSDTRYEIWDDPSENVEALCKAIRAKAGVTIKPAMISQLLMGFAAKVAACSEPMWPDYMAKPNNVPLPAWHLSEIELLEALAMRWKIKPQLQRPVPADYEPADPATVIATGKKPAALAAIAECTDRAMLAQLDKKGLGGDWRRAAVRKRIEKLQPKQVKPKGKTVKPAAAKK